MPWQRIPAVWSFFTVGNMLRVSRTSVKDGLFMKAIKKNYHWVILAILFSEMIIYGGIGNAIGVFTVPISEDLGIGRGAYSLTSSAKALVGTLSTYVAFYVFRKFGYRRSVIFALGICAISCVLRGISNSFGMLMFSQALYGVAIGSLDTQGAVKTVDNWFHAHKGLILGFVSMATGLGGSLMSIVLTGIMESYSWRVASFATGGFFALLIVLYLFMKDKPEQMGLEPYGEQQKSKKKEVKHPGHENWHGRSVKELYRKPAFYLMAVCVFLVVFCAKLSSSTVIPYFQDIGYSATEAALFNSVLMLCLAFAKLGCGELCDLIGAKKVAIICVGCLAAGQFLMAMAQTAVIAYVSVLLLAVGLVMWTIMVPLLTRPLFGYAPSDALIAVFFTMVSLSGFLPEPLINYVYDAVGSYAPVYYGAAILDVVLLVAFLVLFRMCEKDKQKYLQEEAALLGGSPESVAKPE